MNEINHPREGRDGASVFSDAQAKTAQNHNGRAVRRWMITAVCFCLMLAGLNLSPTLASAASHVPVLGGLFQVLTFVNYDKSEDGIHYAVSVPQVDAEGVLPEKVNAEIQERVDQHLAKAQQDWDDYRDAFFATGGTEEEWGDRKMDVLIDYEIKSQTEDRVSFTVSFAESWVSAYVERSYYNLDLAEDRDLTLRDLLGEDWVTICNTAIQEQIDASVDENGFTYFFAPEEGGFTTVDEETGFYIREDGAVMVCFPEYSIAAGAAGTPEFPISLS